MMDLIELVNLNKQELSNSLDNVYGELVEKMLEREGYSVSKIQAIMNNYLDEPDNTAYQEEFKTLQKARKECKRVVKNGIGVDS